MAHVRPRGTLREPLAVDKCTCDPGHTAFTDTCGPTAVSIWPTQGVPVLGFQTDEFPSFFSRSSGCGVTRTVDNVDQVVAMIQASQRLGLRSGMVVACPIPEQYAASGEMIEEAIQQALREADADGILGKAITPYILARVNELTDGASLEVTYPRHYRFVLTYVVEARTCGRAADGTARVLSLAVIIAPTVVPASV